MNTLVRCLALAVAAGMAGCAVGPDFRRPDAPNTAGYTRTPLPTQTVSSESADGTAQRFVPGADVPAAWWQTFRSPQLDALVDAALHANPDLQAADAALRQARQTLAAQRGAYLPSADLQVNASRQKDAQTSAEDAGNSPYSLRTAQLNVSYALDVFGATRRQVEGAAAQVDVQRFQRDAAYLSLTANVVNAAIQVASLRAQLDATCEQIAIAESLLDITRRQHAIGAAGGTDLAAQQAALAQTRAALPPLQKQLEQQRDLLAVLAGRLPSEGVDDTFQLDTLQLPAELPLTLPSQLVERRPDIRAAEAQLHAASAAIGVAEAARFPSFTLTANVGSSAASFSQLFKSGNGLWLAGGGVLQPLFHGGALARQQRAAEAAYDQAQAQYRGVVLQGFQEVSGALTALRSDAEALHLASEAEAATRRSLDMAQQQHALGAIGGAELLQSRQAYQEAQATLVQARAARYSDTVALYQALGGGDGWRADPSTASLTR
jgi:cobalt-zinc-cadmium resistance protein CzcA